MKKLIQTLIILIAATYLSGASSQTHDEGVELGSAINVKSQNPYVIEISVRPKAIFSTINVETPNIISDNKVPCVFVSPAQGVLHTCSINGLVDTKQNGFVVNIVGIKADIPSTVVGSTIRKTYTVPNPAWDKESHRISQERAQNQKGRATTAVNR